MTSSDVWDADAASRYDDPSSPMFSSEILEATVNFLAELAGDGHALEFAIGTGRVAVPLSARGVPVTGTQRATSLLVGTSPSSCGFPASADSARSDGGALRGH